MKRLDRYILREMFVPFLIGTIAVVLMFQINELIALYKNFNLNAVPMTAVLQVILFKTPAYLNMTLPVGVSLASSLAISRLTRESELTAIRSAGVSILRVVRPVMIAGVVGYLFSKMEIPLPPLVLALILGGSTEQNLRNSMVLSDGSPMIFLQKPISAVFLVLAVGTLVYALARRKKQAA